MKEVTHQYDSKPAPLYYVVRTHTGEILFRDACYSICNSFIFVNQIQGVRPKPVYE